jgi:TatD DNase family protein
MASDAHAHPFDLSKLYDGAEAERQALNIICAASAWGAEDFLYNENAAAIFPMALCFAVHPQLPARAEGSKNVMRSLSLLYRFAENGRIDAVGETGFDLFNREFRETEKIQDELFEHHLSVALKYDFPLVIHARRAMQKIFLHTARLKKMPAVVFHSYSGTAGEAASLLRRGVNAYFSFGAAILLNHKTAMASCASIAPERLLFETDAPYQSPRFFPPEKIGERNFSSYADIKLVIKKTAELKHEAGRDCTENELERITDENFYKVYKKRLNDAA